MTATRSCEPDHSRSRRRRARADRLAREVAIFGALADVRREARRLEQLEHAAAEGNGWIVSIDAPTKKCDSSPVSEARPEGPSAAAAPVAPIDERSLTDR